MASPSPNDTKPANSPNDSPLLESLKSKVDNLRRSPRVWQNRYMLLAGLTVLVGGTMLVFQYKQFRAANDLEEAQSALNEEQERQRVAREEGVAINLKVKDLQLATLKSEADKAKRESDEKIAGLVTEAEKARSAIAVAQLATESVRAESAEQLEAEKRKRVELAASLLPRDFFDQSGALSKLAAFPIMRLEFEFVDEREPKDIAEQINGLFHISPLNWPASRRRHNEDFIRDGIAISPGNQRPTLPVVLTEESKWKLIQSFQAQIDSATSVAKILRDSLISCGIDASVGNLGYDLPPGTLLISVGVKPNHVLETTLKELGPREATPLSGIRLGSNRMSIPEQAPDSSKP